MRLNATHAISTPKLLLVPYSAHHVPTYHTWMQDPALQAATASEPLTLEEEYDMQRSWREDKDKLTFIVCLPRTNEESAKEPVRTTLDDAPDRMIGDINLFLFEPDEDEDLTDANGYGNDKSPNQSAKEVSNAVIGEIELMIARKDLHRQGYGRAALETFMQYMITNWPAICQEFAGQNTTEQSQHLAYLRVKIQQTNLGSIALFKSMGFKPEGSGESNYFGEIELRWWWEGRKSFSGGCYGPLGMLDYDDSGMQPVSGARAHNDTSHREAKG